MTRRAAGFLSRAGLAVGAGLLLLAPAVAPASATAGAPAVVGADLHGWFSGAHEVWADKVAVEFTLNYRASPVSQGSAPGFVHLGTVDIDVRDPAGNASPAVSVTYQYFTEDPPVPIGDYGLLDPFDSDHPRIVRVKAAEGAVSGNWRIRARMRTFGWELNGDRLDPRQYPDTLNVTEDWFTFVVHGTATPTTPGGPPTRSGGGAPRTGPPSAPATSRSPAPTGPGDPTTAPAVRAGAGTGSTPDSPLWPVMLVAAGAFAVFFGGATLVGYYLLNRTRARRFRR